MTGVWNLIAGAALALVSAAPVLSGNASADNVDMRHFEGRDVLLLGELHDNRVHHLNQAQIIEQAKPRAVIFEMLSPEQASRLSSGVPSDAGEAAALLEWDASGWPDYAIYHPVFRASSGARIYGAALPRERVRAAVTGDIVEIFGDEAARFGLNLPLSEEEQSEREAMQGKAHCDALPVEILPGMVAAQRLRDAHFARVTLKALAETGGPVAVVTGNGHARTDWGMPVYLNAASPDVSVVALGQFEAPPEPGAPFDVVLSAPPMERSDPCEAFR